MNESSRRGFSPNTFQITPLGAAIVEALPDRKKVNRIKRAFRERATCPASALFTKAESDAWALWVSK